MDAKAALKAYRDGADPRIKEAVDSFNLLTTAMKLELLYYMICNTNLLLTGGEHEALGAAPAETPPISETKQ